MTPLQGIIDLMMRTRNRLLRGSAVLFAIFMAVLVLANLLHPLPNAVYRTTMVLAAFLIISSLYLLILAATISHPQKHPVIRHLREEKHQIVWVYSFVSINMPFGVHLFKLVTIWLHYRDGSQQIVRIGHKHLKQCMKCLENELPHATFGYSVKNEQLYRANPELLERE